MRWVVFLFIWLLPVILFFNGLLASNACADGINFSSELTYENSDSKTTIKTTGEKIDSDSYRFDQRYNLDLSKTIYPYLTFATGTTFEWDNATSKTEGTKIETEERVLQPFVELRLNNPIYQASLEYRRTEVNEDTTDLPNTETIRNEYDAVLGWRPAELPQVFLRYSYTDTHDDPETVDLIDKLLTLEADYTVWKELRLSYLYTRTDTDNQITSLETLQQTHFGRAEYSHNFLDERLSLNSIYSMRYNTLEFSGAGVGTGAEIPLQRSQGLFSLDNTPQDGPALAVNNALIDGDLIASSGIDIGLAGDETTLTNIGLDLGLSVDVDEIRIWVDRRLSGSVADSFSWDVYTSPDNTDSSTWTLVATVSPALFGTVENRFQISFPAVNTRFIKVVTTPLSPAVPGAGSFPNIFVTEMQAFSTISDISAQDKTTTIEHTYDLNLRARLTDKTVLGYNLHYLFQDQDPISNKRTQLSNDIYLDHTFNKVFSTGARISRADEEVNGEDSVKYTYSALIRGGYLPTFDQTLTYSGTNTKEDEGSSYDNTLILRSNAKLYRGWSAFVDMGYNWDKPLDSEREKSILFRLGTNFEPSQKITLNMNYQLRKITQPEETSRYDLNLEAFYIPFITLYFNARFNVVDRGGSDRRTLQNYVVNWSPFPDGDLQFFFTYNETLRSVEDERERTIGPSLNWVLANHFFLEMFYNIRKTESNSQKIESNNFFAQLRMVF